MKKKWNYRVLANKTLPWLLCKADGQRLVIVSDLADCNILENY